MVEIFLQLGKVTAFTIVSALLRICLAECHDADFVFLYQVFSLTVVKRLVFLWKMPQGYPELLRCCCK